MKFLLMLLLVMVGVWLWRSSRQAASQRPSSPPKATAEPLNMVRCALCAVHLPATDAVQGQKGLYCSTEHLQRAEP